MKLNFSVQMQGKDSIEEKFRKALANDKALTHTLAFGFAVVVQKAIGLTKDDDLSITKFSVDKSDEEGQNPPLLEKVQNEFTK